MQQVACPSCGNTVKFLSQASCIVVCDACSSILVKQDMDIEKIGDAAALQEDGSLLQIGATGQYQDVAFEIIGRIQVQYPSGYWNEWFASYKNGGTGWIGEAQGNYFVSFQTAVQDEIPPFEELTRGKRLVLDEKQFVVTQVQKAKVISCEGELPFAQPDGYEAPQADLRTDTTMGATLDYSEEPPMVFIGEYMEFDELNLSRLRDLDGW